MSGEPRVFLQSPHRGRKAHQGESESKDERGAGNGTKLEVDIRVQLGAGELEIRLESDALTVAVFGPSGGGKSTLLRTLAGVEKRATGVVKVGEEVWLDTGRGVFVHPWERGVGWVPQDYLLFPHLNVEENLRFGGGSLSEVEEMARLLFVDHLLERRPRRLSGGEQQRVALGRALLSRPRLLLLDEPFSALDRPLRNRVGSQLKTFVRTRNIPLLLVSHDEADAAALAREHWLLSQGRLERVADPGPA
jgi:molybdate transport system ATP-binding protein